MTIYEMSENKKTIVIYSDKNPSRKFNLYFHKHGVVIAHGEDGDGGTIYESIYVDFSLIPENIRVDVMFTYTECAVEHCANYGIGIGRYNSYTDVIRDYLEKQSKTF